jgi:hypothetical protein
MVGCSAESCVSHILKLNERYGEYLLNKENIYKCGCKIVAVTNDNIICNNEF